MIIAQSRFRVVNGMEDEVAEAFLNRPGLVDTAEGFLGLEVFTDAEDPAAFYLVTRWSNAACFEQWHNGPAHRASHRFMPKGLKLDPKHTQIVRMERIAPADAAPPMADRVRDAAPLLARFLPNADTLHCIEASRAGEVYDMTPTMRCCTA